MDWGYMFFLAVMVVVITGAFIFMGVKQNKHQQEQKENNTEKKEMLDLMTRVMEAEYPNYTYLVGYFTKVQQKIGSTVYYYFPYILAFTSNELIIFPFIKKDKQLYIRNRLDVDWRQTELKVKYKKNGVVLTFKMLGEKMPINVDAVIKGTGVEKSDRPLCVFQEQEYDLFLKYLPGFIAKAKNS
ncbi:MAG: hypothetical protein J6Z22_07235 [Lachnospiraceae bacterium]|nr:hypothetical protein [Lachnospiraceae bacterium]